MVGETPLLVCRVSSPDKYGPETIPRPRDPGLGSRLWLRVTWRVRACISLTGVESRGHWSVTLGCIARGIEGKSEKNERLEILWFSISRDSLSK